MQPRGRIVVGVDGSAPARAAVRWAARLARRTGGPLEAVAVWDFPCLFGEHGLVPPALDGFEPERRAAEILDEAAADCGLRLDCGLRMDCGLRLDRRLKAGPPGPALVVAAAGAALLVLGNRGHSTPPDAPLGTVAQYCLHHAPCPVAVVRADGARTGP
ncbi:universal stress protein [Kitasatospora sp. NPDC059088]|uniref:universal stress protein n=1 Tax=Kitasatospora sp. NPDC059088 TaxID=3346722 RepID=UPI0036834354